MFVKVIIKCMKQNGWAWERAQLFLKFPFAGFMLNIITLKSHSVLLSIMFPFMRK